MPRLKGEGERTSASIMVEVEIALNPDADPELVCGAVGDFLCSLGENDEARELLDEQVRSFDSWDWKGR